MALLLIIRQYFKWCIYSIVAIIAISCQSNNNSNFKTSESEKIEQTTPLNFIGHWKNEGDRGKLVREVANEFEFTHQDIKVNLKFPEDLYNADDSLEIKFIIKQIQMPSADWDIIRIKEHYYPIASKLNDPDWGKKYLVDFSEIPGFVNLNLPIINTSVIKQRTGNICIGPYNEGFYWAIFLNTDVAKRIGINIKQYDMTFDDLLGYVKAVYEYNKTSHTHIAAIFEDKGWISTETLFKRLCYSLCSYKEILDTRLTKEKLTAIEKGYEACEQLSAFHPIINSRMQIDWGRDNDFPLKDSCLFFINGSWMYNIWVQKSKEGIRKMLPCELPVFKPSDSYVGGYTCNWAVPKNAAHKKEAIQMMMYWCKPEIAEKWARYTKCPSGVKGNLTSSTFGLDPYESFVYNIEKKYGDRKVHPVSNAYLFGDKNFRLPLRVIEVLEGKMTSAQAVKEFKQKAQY